MLYCFVYDTLKFMELPRFVMLDKAVGQTPLQCMEAWRNEVGISADIPLTYAGRLDPMASGKLLILVGEECKKKDDYLTLDKTYEFSVLFGIGSDTHDVLGRLQTSFSPKIDQSSVKDRATPILHPSKYDAKHTVSETSNLEQQLQNISNHLIGEIELPYPHFSSKTVKGKPLHTWTLEGRLGEIKIPTKTSIIYSLTLDKIEIKLRSDVAREALAKINTIPEVTEERKALGNDFRRSDVRADWESIQAGTPLPRAGLGRGGGELPEHYTITHFTCTASSGTYMRTLAKLIGEQLNPPTPSLAWSIHRTQFEFEN